MTKCVVLIPGILGSQLVDQSMNRVWPPNLLEFVTGYRRITELKADDLRALAIISSVSIYPVYRSLLDDIARCDYSVGDPQRRFVPYPYDWRRSNADSATGLADVLDDIPGIEEIILLAHSMGGLVARYLLESGKFSGRAWFPSISTLITMGTPHFGAPNALARLRGQDSVLRIKGSDIVSLAADTRYPALYQLVGPDEVAFTIPSTPRGLVPTPLDSFDTAIVTALSLNPTNVTASRDFWAALDLDKRPKHVQYFFFGGAAHKTTARNELRSAGLEPIERQQAGDGTVPISSAIVPSVAHGFSMKEHTHLFEDRNVREALYDFLGAPAGVQPLDAYGTADVGMTDAFGISVDKDTYHVSEKIEIVASYNSEVVDPAEAFQIIPLDAHTGARDPDKSVANVHVQFQGVAMTSFSMVITPNLDPGLYELRPLRAVDDPEPTYFVVVTADG